MSDKYEDEDVVSIETARMKRAVQNMEIHGGSPANQMREFRIMPGPEMIALLDDLQERLGARNYGQVLISGLGVLKACLERIEKGQKIVAIDDASGLEEIVGDPRFENPPEPKTPA